MQPFRFKFDDNVLYSQAFGTWLYLHVGDHALFFGTHMPFGLRVEWHDGRRRFRFVRHR